MSPVGVTEQGEASGATALSNPTKIPQKVSKTRDLRYYGVEDYLSWRWRQCIPPKNYQLPTV
jgi:hypothetical protein